MDAVSTSSNILVINFSKEEQTLLSKNLLNLHNVVIQYTDFKQCI